MIFSEISRRFHGLDAFLKVLLCVVLVVSLCPPLAGAFAEEPDADGADAPAAQAQAADAEGEGEAPDAALAGEDGQDALPAAEASDDATDAVENVPDVRADGAGDSGKASGNAAGKADAVAADDAKAASEGSTSSSTQLDGAILLKAKANGIRATLLVDASAELPAGAKLVVTPLVKHEAVGEGDADEAESQDDEASDKLEGSEAADAEGATLEAQREEAEEAVAAADDEATNETGTDAAAENEAATSEGDEATADEPTTITGAQAALSGMTKAVQAYRAKKKAGDATVVDAYAIEVVDAQGHVVPVDDDAAKLTVTLEDGDEDAADYDKVYAVERDAKEQQSVSDAAETEYADEDAAAEGIPYQAEAADVTESAKTDEQAEETTVELDGVRSIATTTEDAVADDAAAKKPKAGGPRKSPATNLTAKKGNRIQDPNTNEWVQPAYLDWSLRKTEDTVSLGMTINLFDYVASDDKDNNHFDADPKTTWDAYGNKTEIYGDGTQSGINEGKSSENQLKFYATGDGKKTNTDSNNISHVTSPTTENGINQFTGSGYSDNDFWTLQYANQGIVQPYLSNPDEADYAKRYPLLNTNAYDKSTEYLFNPSHTLDSDQKRTTYQNVNHLFYIKPSTKGTAAERLEYDSNESYAYYTDEGTKKDNGNFVVYDGTYDRDGGSKSGMKVGFFPFNDWGTTGALPCINPNETNWNNQTKHVDHHLGLTLNTPFVMPLNGEIQVGNSNADMVFEFSGDDDMWIFVDGRLVLDIGGIHQPVHGTINFNTGIVQLSRGTVKQPIDNNKPAREITQSGYAVTAKGTNENPDLPLGTTVYLWDTDVNGVHHKGLLGSKDSAAWRAGTSHTLQAFYLERGGCDSNLMISTNIHLMAKRQASVEKEWDQTPKDKRGDVEVQLIRKAVKPGTTELVGYALVAQDTLGKVNNDDAASWKKIWKDLPTQGYNACGYYVDYNADGTAKTDNVFCDYTYLVREVPKSGYKITYKSGNNEITAEKVGTFDKKAVQAKSATNVSGVTVTGVGDSGGQALRPDSINLNADNAYAVAWDGLPVANEYTANQGVGVNPVEYRLGQSDSTEGAAIPADYSTVTIVNKWEPTSLTVKKNWEDGDDNHSGETVYVQLRKDNKDVANALVELKANMGNEDPWTHTFKNLDPEGVYTVVEKIKSGNSYADAKVGGTFALGDKTYKLVSIQYTNANGTKVENLDGTAKPDAGIAVITNGPVTTDIVVKKVDADDNNVALPGAKFEVLKAIEGESDYNKNKNYEKVTTSDGDTFVTDNNGTFQVKSLVPGKYWILETGAPEGYLLQSTNNPILVEVKADGTLELVNRYDANDKTAPKVPSGSNEVNLIVPNAKVYELPSTAGPGILELVFLGAFVMTLAVGLWRRREPEPARARR